MKSLKTIINQLTTTLSEFVENAFESLRTNAYFAVLYNSNSLYLKVILYSYLCYIRLRKIPKPKRLDLKSSLGLPFDLNI